jgi:hypothetical protein
LSTYGIVPIASEGSGVGTHLAVNGVVLETSEEVFARLAVAPTIVTLSLARGDDRPVEVTLSGLPDDEDQYLYLGSYQDWRVIHPGDGGTATVTTVLDEPRVLWVQPTRGTVVISSDPAVPDQCEAARGVREGGTCTFTDDVEGPVEIVGPGQTLDCAGHTITRVGDSGAVGIVLGMPWNDAPPSAPSDTTVRNCVVGVPGEPFATGLLAWGAQNLAVEDCTFVENFDGILAGPGANMRLERNAVVDARRYGISVQGPATTNEIRQNSVMMETGHAQQAIGLRLAGLFAQAVAGETTFCPRPVTATLVADNAVAGGTHGLWLEIATGNELTGNDVDGAERGLFILDEFAWPNPRRT